MNPPDRKLGRDRWLLRSATVAIALGAGLFAFQVVGLFLEPNSNTPAGTMAGFHYTTLPIAELESLMTVDQALPDEKWLRHANNVVGGTLAWSEAVTLRPAHSWTLWLATVLTGDKLMATQDPQVIASTGSALCSQSARVLQFIASKAGLPTRFVSFNGHVILEVKTEGRWLAADTTYDILYPFALEGLVDPSNTTLIRSLLAERGFESVTSGYLEIIHSGSEVRHPIGEPHEPKPARYERMSIWLSWILPFIMILGGSLGRLLHDDQGHTKV